MKSKMKSKIRAAAMSLVMAFTMIAVLGGQIYARGKSDPDLVLSGDTSHFAGEAPITTIVIDKSKLDKDNLLFSEPGKPDQLPSSGITFTFKDGYVYAEGVTINAGYKELGNFSFVYKDAAILRDGTKANLEVIFDKINVIREKTGPTYNNEKIRIAYAGDAANGKPLAFTPLSEKNPDQYFALRSEIKFRVGKSGQLGGDESFLFSASDINMKRGESHIVNDYGNQNYSESVEPLYGINGESDLYLPSSTNLTENPSGSWNRTFGGYEHRFMVNSSVANPSSDPYDFGFVAAARAGGSSDSRTNNGFITRVWSSAGPDFEQSQIHFMNLDVTHTITSSSGEKGKIELWTDGRIHDTDQEEYTFRRLEGGTKNVPYRYAVPKGKEVTYKMTPDDGYVLDQLTINGSAINQDTDKNLSIVYNSSNKVSYYTYHFGADTANKNQSISVTWREDHILSRKDKIEATCSKAGREAYWECQKCKKMFSDPEGRNLITQPVVIPAAGHKWDAGKVTKKATEKQTGTRTYTCTVCKAIRTQTIPKRKPSASKSRPVLIAKAKAKGRSSLVISWNKIQGAACYDIFFARCNHHGKKLTCKKVKTIKGNKTLTWTKSGLKKGTAYKAYVKAAIMKDGKKKYIRSSPIIHSYTGNGIGNYTNARSVTVNKTRLTLKKGRTFKLRAQAEKVRMNKKLMPENHAATLRYMTSDSKIATVNSSGRITAKGKGSCFIYVFAHNGLSKKVDLKVK